jgi:serine/threonine-protein kinase
VPRARFDRTTVEAFVAALSLLGLVGAGIALGLTLHGRSVQAPATRPVAAVVAPISTSRADDPLPRAAEPIVTPETLPVEALPFEAPQDRKTEERKQEASTGPTMLSLSSVPPSSVVVDGRPLGTTPLAVSVAPGGHSVLFVSPDGGRVQKRVVVAAGRTQGAFVRFGG